MLPLLESTFVIVQLPFDRTTAEMIPVLRAEALVEDVYRNGIVSPFGG